MVHQMNEQPAVELVAIVSRYLRLLENFWKTFGKTFGTNDSPQA